MGAGARNRAMRRTSVPGLPSCSMLRKSAAATLRAPSFGMSSASCAASSRTSTSSRLRSSRYSPKDRSPRCIASAAPATSIASGWRPSASTISPAAAVSSGVSGVRRVVSRSRPSEWDSSPRTIECVASACNGPLLVTIVFAVGCGDSQDLTDSRSSQLGISSIIQRQLPDRASIAAAILPFTSADGRPSHEIAIPPAI